MRGLFGTTTRKDRPDDDARGEYPQAFKEADRVAKLVAMASRQAGNEHEAALAREKAVKAIREIDLRYLDILADQRLDLIEDLRAEQHRLMYGGRATKRDTGDLVDRAAMLLNHYQKADALIPAVEVLRLIQSDEQS